MQQFLYTFRYFCTPQDFLHFLLDRINSTLSRYGRGPRDPQGAAQTQGGPRGTSLVTSKGQGVTVTPIRMRAEPGGRRKSKDRGRGAPEKEASRGRRQEWPERGH